MLGERFKSEWMQVSRLGLGCMGLSAFYGKPIEEDAGVNLIKHAISSGVTFLDTSDVYGPFTNEVLIGKVHMIHHVFKSHKT